MNGLGRSEGLVDGVDRAGRDTGAFEFDREIVSSPSGDETAEQGREFVAILRPHAVGDESRVVGEIRPAQDGHQGAELPVVGGTDEEVTVEGSEDLIRHDRRVVVAGALGHLPLETQFDAWGCSSEITESSRVMSTS